MMLIKNKQEYYKHYMENYNKKIDVTFMFNTFYNGLVIFGNENQLSLPLLNHFYINEQVEKINNNEILKKLLQYL